jgi:hypothetical protein
MAPGVVITPDSGLDLELEGERTIVCTKTGQAVVFSSAKLPEDEE